MKTKDNGVRATGGCALRVVVIILLIFFACSPGRQFYHRKYPYETTRSYQEKRGLMILESTRLGRNKYFYSHHNTKVRKTRPGKHK